MERKVTPPPAVAAWSLPAEVPNSLDSTRRSSGGGEGRARPRSSRHAETKKRPTAAVNTDFLSSSRKSMSNNQRRTPLHSNRKRPLRPLGLPSLASPSAGTHLLSTNSSPQGKQCNSNNPNTNSQTYQIDDESSNDTIYHIFWTHIKALEPILYIDLTRIMIPAVKEFAWMLATGHCQQRILLSSVFYINNPI